MNEHTKNKLATPGYFIKRLKDSDIFTWRMFDKYSERASRKWTVLVDPGGMSIYITCFENKPFKEYAFCISDGDQNIKTYNLKTDSIEVVVTRLIEYGVGTKDNNPLFQEKVKG